MLLFTILQAAQQTAPQAAQRPGAGWEMWGFLLLIMVVMWLFMIRPQRKQQKEMEEFRKSLKKGDKVVTAGGIYGVIIEAQEDKPYVILGIDDEVKIRISKNALVKDTNANA